MMEVEVPSESTVLQVVQKVAEIGGAKLKDLILKNGGIDGNLIVMLNKKESDCDAQQEGCIDPWRNRNIRI